MDSNRFDAVLFDLDGTLLYTLPDICYSVNATLKKFGYPERSLQEIRSFVGNASRKLIERSLPSGAANVEEVLAEYLAYYRQHSSEHTEYYPGIQQLLCDLRRRGIKTGVVTNKPQGTASVMMERFFGNDLDCVYGQREGVPVKPAPDGVWEAMAALGAAKECTLFVGDSPVDAQTAENAGLPCLLVDWGYTNLPVLQACRALAIVSDARQILAAVEAH